MKNCPYVGPRPFMRGDRELFRGRDREARDLVALIQAYSIVLVHAPSGAGKTSLINAQIVPRLAEGGCDVLANGRVSGRVPAELRAQDIKNIFTFNLLSTLGRDATPPQKLAKTSLQEFVSNHFQSQAPSAMPSPLVLVFDQFEEIFTHWPERWRDRALFFEDLATAFRSERRLRVVLSMREEFIAKLDPFAPDLPGQLRTRFRVTPLTRQAALQAVKEPAQDSGVPFRQGVAEELVNNLQGGEFVEPLHLQVVCRNIWEKLPEGTTQITKSFLLDYGDVDDALSGYFEDSIRKTSKSQKIPEGKLRSWFGEKLILSERARNLLPKDDPPGQTAGLPNEVVDVLDKVYHLIRPESRGDTIWYELSHDRFIRPILHANDAWRNEYGGTGKYWECRARAWKEKGQPESALPDITELRRAKPWLASVKGVEIGTSETLKDFIAAAELRAKSVRTRSLVKQVVLLACLLAGALFAAFRNYHLLTRAEAATQRAKLSERKASVARREAEAKIADYLLKQGGNDFHALAYAIRSVEPSARAGEEPVLSGVSALREASSRIGDGIWLRRAGESFEEAIFSPDSKRLLLRSDSGLSLWDSAKGTLTYTKTNLPDLRYRYPRFSPTGRYLTAWLERKEVNQIKQTVIEEAVRYAFWNALDGSSVPWVDSLMKDGSYVFDIRGNDEKALVIRKDSPPEIRRMDQNGQVAITLTTNPTENDGNDRWTLSPKANYAAHAAANRITVWDLTWGEKAFDWSSREGGKRRENSAAPVSADFPPDESLVIVFIGGYFDYSSVTALNPRSGQRVWVHPLPTEWDNRMSFVGFSADSASLVFVSRKESRVVEMKSGNVIARHSVPPTAAMAQFTSYQNAVVLYAARGEKGSKLTLWDPLTGATIVEKEFDPSFSLSKASVSDDRKWLVFTGANGACILPVAPASTPALDQLSIADLLARACRQLRSQPEFNELNECCRGTNNNVAPSNSQTP